MPQRHVVSIDPSKPLGEEPGTGHNRWHEAVEPVVEVAPGDTVVYETRDAFDGQLSRESTAEDVGNQLPWRRRFSASAPATVS
jgi:formamidase